MSIADFEDISNIVQLLVSLAVTGFLLLSMRHSKCPNVTFYVAIGCCSMTLGDLYWQVHILLYQDSPAVLSASDIAWLGEYFFYMAAHFRLFPEREPVRPPLWVYAFPALVVANCVWWIVVWGDVVWNVLWGISMSAIALCVSMGLFRIRQDSALRCYRPLYVAWGIWLLCQLVQFISGGWLYPVMDLLQAAAIVGIAMSTFYAGRKGDEAHDRR